MHKVQILQKGYMGVGVIIVPWKEILVGPRSATAAPVWVYSALFHGSLHYLVDLFLAVLALVLGTLGSAAAVVLQSNRPSQTAVLGSHAHSALQLQPARTLLQIPVLVLVPAR